MSVCVLMSTYNGEKFISEQLDSLCNQNCGNIVICIRDDGSKDGTIPKIEEWHRMHPEIDITVTWGKENLGYARSFMSLVNQAPDNADYYAFCDQDDVWMENKMSRAIEKLGVSDQPRLYSSQPLYVDEKLNPIKGIHRKMDQLPFGEFSTNWALEANICGLGCSLVWNKALQKIVSKGDYSKLIWGHDNLMTMVAGLCGSIYRDNERTFYYRQHGNNTAGDKTAKKSIIKTAESKKKQLEQSKGYKTRLLIYNEFKEQMSRDNREFLKLTIDYKDSFVKTIRLLFMPLARGLGIKESVKCKIRVMCHTF